MCDVMSYVNGPRRRVSECDPIWACREPGEGPAGCLYFLYLNVSLVQWIRRNIHGISNKNCWQIFMCLVELSSILQDSSAMLHLCTRSAFWKSFFAHIKVSGPKPERSIPMFVTRVDSTMSTLSCLNMRNVIDGVEFYLARVYSLPAQTSFS